MKLEPPPCGSCTEDQEQGEGHFFVCELLAGHVGWHRSGEASWGPWALFDTSNAREIEQ